MASVNKVILIGNLGKDPEVRHTRGGDPVVSFTLATGETWKDKDSGERKERTEWHRVVIFNDRLGEIAEKYLRKGSRVYLEGGLQTRKWTDQSGQERYTTEVVISRFKGELTLIGGRGEGGAAAVEAVVGVAGDVAGVGAGGAVELLELVDVELVVDVVEVAVLEVVQERLVDVALALAVLVAQVLEALVRCGGRESDRLEVHGCSLCFRWLRGPG